MEVTIKIEGMMCPHCEAHVKKALEGVSGVTEATASHKDGVAVVKLENGVDLAVLKAVIENAGYKVV